MQTVRAPAEPGSRWLHGSVTDVLVGWSWLPMAVLVHAASADLWQVQRIMIVVFLLSFAHQPLTLALVYGDPAQRAAHRRLYSLAPLAVIGAVTVGLWISLTLVAVVAVLWNAEHTLMQRYGVIRIYGRKSGDGHGPLEKPMLIAWLVTAVGFIGAYVDLPALAARLGVDETNTRGIELLQPLRAPALAVFWGGVCVSVWLTARWVRAERALGHRASCPKHVYVGATLGLLLAVMIDPAAGVAGYVFSHAIEYFAVVHRSLRTRRDDAGVARITRTASRRVVAYAAYFAAVLAFARLTYRPLDGRVYGFAILVFGALHILFDGLVWKLRRPAVAASLGVAPVAG